MSLLSRIPGKQRDLPQKELLVQCQRVLHHADRVTPEIWLLQERAPGVTACKQDTSLPSWKKLGEIAAKKPQPQAKCQQVIRCAMLCFSSDLHSAAEEFLPLFKRIC